MNSVKKQFPKKLQYGIPLKIRKGHTVLLETTREPLTVHTGLSLFYAMAEALEIPRTWMDIFTSRSEKGDIRNPKIFWPWLPMPLSVAISWTIWKPSGKMWPFKR